MISKGDLVVGERGEVDGEIEAGRIFVSGTVRGRMRAARRVEITARGRVYAADLETPSLVIEDGAFFEGRCSMGKPRTEAPAADRPVVTRLPLTKEG